MNERSPKANPASDDEATPYPPASYAWWVVFVLMVTYVFSFIDRQILTLLVEPIRADLGISDTQMGLLMGLSFAIFYTTFGIPVGRIADSSNRRFLILAGLTLWSLMTAGIARVRSFGTFFLLRMGVGVGEATLSPAAYSMIADYFPRRRLATAISVYSMGIYIGSGLAYIVGGTVIRFAREQDVTTLPLFGPIRPWQLVFLIVGAGGILPFLLLLTVREPVRRGVRRKGSVPLKDVFAYFAANRWTLVTHHLGISLLTCSAYGSSAWIPAFLIRTHAMERASVGFYYGIVVLIAGTAGIVVGGRLADWLSARGYRDAKMRVALLASVLWLPTGIAYLHPGIENLSIVFALLTPTVFFTSMPMGVGPAAVQELMPNRLRAQASAIYLFVINLVGLGLGPAIVPFISDSILQDESRLWLSLMIVNAIAHVGAAVALWLGLAPFRKSLDYLEEWTERDKATSTSGSAPA